MTDLYGLSVAVVGGAGVPDHGPINLHDIVVFTNNHWLKNKQCDIDVLFHCGTPKKEVNVEALLNDPDFAEKITEIHMPPYTAKFGVTNEWCLRHCIPIHTYEHNRERPELAWFVNADSKVKRYGSKELLTGVAAIMYYLQFPIIELHTYNMTLYKNESYNPLVAAHNMEAHAHFLSELVEYDYRVTLNPELSQAVSDLTAKPAALCPLDANRPPASPAATEEAT